VKNARWSVVQDLTGSWGPYAHNENQWVGYDDPESVMRKARYVITQGFAGMYVWTMDLDDFNNDCCMGSQPLLKTVAKELRGYEYDHNRYDCSQPSPPVTPEPPPKTTTAQGMA